MEKRYIPVYFTGGRKTVPVYLSETPGLSVTKSRCKFKADGVWRSTAQTWIIVHTNSGLRVWEYPRLRTRNDALAAAKLLGAAGPWGQGKDWFQDTVASANHRRVLRATQSSYMGGDKFTCVVCGEEYHYSFRTLKPVVFEDICGTCFGERALVDYRKETENDDRMSL